MKKHNSILVLVAVLALIVTSCNLQINSSNSPQPGPIPQGQQQPGPIPQDQPGPIPQGQPGPGPIPQDQQQPQPPTPGLPPAPTQSSGSSESSGSSGSSGSGCAGAPVIPYFNANSTSITSGQSVTLSWGNITNGSTGPLVGSTTIEPGLGEVGSGASSRTVKPNSTTTYTLTGTGCGGTTSKQVTVTVNSSNPTATMLQLFKANWDLAVANIYPSATGHIMVTIKNAGNMTINATITITCLGTSYTPTVLPAINTLGPTSQSVSFNLKAGEKFDQDTTFSRNPTITKMLVSCSITPPSGDTNSSNDSMGPIKVK